MWSPPPAAAAVLLAAVTVLPYQGTEADVTTRPLHTDERREVTLSETYRRLHAAYHDVHPTYHDVRPTYRDVHPTYRDVESAQNTTRPGLKFPKDRGRQARNESDFSKLAPARNHIATPGVTAVYNQQTEIDIQTTMGTKEISDVTVTLDVGHIGVLPSPAALSASSPRSVLAGVIPPVRSTRTVPAGRTQDRRRKTETGSGSPLLNYIFDTYSTTHQHRNDRLGPGGGGMTAAEPAVEALVGSTAHLDCKVDALHDKLVSWVRRKGNNEAMELLTTGTQKYTADDRYSARFLAPDTWRLEVREVRASDAADYDCQLSAHPPRTARVALVVPAVSVVIVDGAGAPVTEQVCEEGSTVALRCEVRGLRVEGGRALHWYRRDTLLNDDIVRGGISVRTELLASGADSVLRVARVGGRDAGQYTCLVHAAPAAAPLAPAHVTLHVIQGESLAELHAGTATTLDVSITIIITCTLSILV